MKTVDPSPGEQNRNTSLPEMSPALLLQGRGHFSITGADVSDEIPDHNRWQRFLLREWRPAIPPKGGKDQLIVFALLMASHTATGEMYVSAERLAEATGLTPGGAKTRRSRCVRAGVLRDTGRRKYGERVLVRAIPKDHSVSSGNASVSSGDQSIERVREESKRGVSSGNASPAQSAPVSSLSSSVVPPPPDSSTIGKERSDERRDVAPVSTGNASVSEPPLCDRCGDVNAPGHTCPLGTGCKCDCHYCQPLNHHYECAWDCSPPPKADNPWLDDWTLPSSAKPAAALPV